jgi:two-component system chemotaxis response regulator CheY
MEEAHVKKILLVDDSEVIRQQCSAALLRAGFAVVEAADGLDGLSCMEKEQFALVILDVNMPRMDGLEMLMRVRAEPKFASVPIVMLTTEAHHAMIAKAKLAGARGCMVKPVKPEHLVSTAVKLTESH